MARCLASNSCRYWLWQAVGLVFRIGLKMSMDTTETKEYNLGFCVEIDDSIYNN